MQNYWANPTIHFYRQTSFLAPFLAVGMADTNDTNNERHRARAAEVRRIAQEAIQNITHLSNLIGSEESTFNSSNRSTSGQPIRSRPTTGDRNNLPASPSNGSGSHRYRDYARENAVSELRRRFPSTGSAG